jgi:hypothetical protein
MMKALFTSLRRAARPVLAAGLAWLLLAAPTQARLDDTQEMLEARLLSDRTAKRIQLNDVETLAALGDSQIPLSLLPGHDLIREAMQKGQTESFSTDSIDQLLWDASGEAMPAPTPTVPIPRPPDFPEYIYFKTDDGTPAEPKLKSIAGNNGQRGYAPPPAITGWELRVYVYKNVSVMEIYHRVGASLTDDEIAQVLAANQGTATWNHSGMAPSADFSNITSPPSTFIGYEYERSDGQLRATHKGSDLAIFNAGLDRRLVQLKISFDQSHAPLLKQSAGVSTKGF